VRTTLVSDAHLHGLDDPNQALLVDFLRAWETDELVLVGDIFDAWWAWRHTVWAAGVPLLGALWDLRRRGVRVTWVGGNHDWAAGPVLERDLGVVAAERWEGHAGPTRVIAVHGDGAEASAGQRALDAVLRGLPARAAMRIVGPDAAWDLARRLSASSRAYGGPGLERVLEGQRRLADRLLAEGAGVVCVGHSHAPGIEERPGGRLVNLGDWLHHHTFAVVEEDVRLLRWDGSAATPVDGPMARRV
jgi:UDP-2,3-diacylglucosamine hydrolase